MKRALVLLLALACAWTAGCDGAPAAGVVLWHAYSGREREALEATAATWNAAHPEQPLTLVAVPYDSFADKLTSAIPGGNGPDLFIYQQDRIGNWADAGVLEPIEFWVDDARAARFTDQALQTMAYHGSLWGLPMTLKSFVLYYRTDLMPTAPRTTDELVAVTAKMKARGGYAFAYPNVDLYGHAPWLHGFGGAVMDDDTGKLMIATPQAAAAMTFARQLVVSGASPPEAQPPQIASLFNEGKAAAVMSGPWFIPDIAPNVPWAVAPLPIVSATGRPAAPFLGAEGILMSSHAHDKDAAFAVMDALTGDVAAIERARMARQVVANKAAWDDPVVAADPVLRVFRDQVARAVPMPKHPSMRSVWTPYRTALGEVIAGRREPGEQLLELEHEIAGYAHGGGS